ncbi:alpha/beta hydrolase [Kurthia sibirica]|uniref:Alpha/beta hydrolase n=1 Tax=Kurthia sibirica TaxID=202750 RepID=A0A2U3AIK3_9BACL|nr:alpha/beta hydrolase [Kurthia sibirica]PWI24379.1 alpha/beta hydrolase [Kurthia sibirica]GEK33796.1 lipase [Kurthia sibirica]
MKLFKKITAIIILLLLAASAFIYFSPKPAALLINYLFKDGVAVKAPDYDSIVKNTRQLNDISYTSKYKDGTLDIVVPKNHTNPVPVVLWVHGGAYVGGDKKDVTEYAVQLAAKGYAVVNMNYELAPGAKYPTPLKQMDEVYAFMVKNAIKYQLDINNLYIAGDSAGAQIASQYINIQVDDDYAAATQMTQKIPPNTIKAALLFCGPYDLTAFNNLGDNKVISFFLDRVAWAYIGERNWQQSDQTILASMTDQISEHFVPTFITDGNSGSFENQGKKLSAILQSYDIPVEEVFYPLDEAILGHEYQFMMDLPEAQHTFNTLVQFMEQQ